MKDKYYELTEKDADEVSDAGIMLRLLAGELFGLNSYIEWLKRSMFISGAEGEALELHARQRGIERSIGSKAVGSILVEVDSPLEYDVVIPAGTVFSTSDGTLYYESTQQGVIYSGTGRTLLEARAEYSGSRYNVEAGEVTTVVTYFSSGLSISNASAFTGGTDDESDDSLRKRLLESYRSLYNGVNIAYFCRLAESVEGVQSSSVIFDSSNPGWLVICLAGRGAAPDEQAQALARSRVREGTPLGIGLVFANSTLIPVDVTASVTVKQGYDSDEVIAAVQNAVREYFLDLRIGEDFRTAVVGKVILEIDGVENYAFSNTQDAAMGSSDLAVLQNLTVTAA